MEPSYKYAETRLLRFLEDRIRTGAKDTVSKDTVRQWLAASQYRSVDGRDDVPLTEMEIRDAEAVLAELDDPVSVKRFTEQYREAVAVNAVRTDDAKHPVSYIDDPDPEYDLNKQIFGYGSLIDVDTNFESLIDDFGVSLVYHAAAIADYPVRHGMPVEYSDELAEFGKLTAGVGTHFIFPRRSFPLGHIRWFDRGDTRYIAEVQSDSMRYLSAAASTTPLLRDFFNKYRRSYMHILVQQVVKSAREAGRTRIAFPTGPTAMKVQFDVGIVIDKTVSFFKKNHIPQSDFGRKLVTSAHGEHGYIVGYEDTTTPTERYIFMSESSVQQYIDRTDGINTIRDIVAIAKERRPEMSVIYSETITDKEKGSRRTDAEIVEYLKEYPLTSPEILFQYDSGKIRDAMDKVVPDLTVETDTFGNSWRAAPLPPEPVSYTHLTLPTIYSV